jgi:hypothetical protein
MMAITRDRPPAGTSSHGESTVRAWVGVALIPVFFVLGFVVGEVLYSVLGYKPENDDAPLWADLVASLPALAVTLVPCLVAVIYGWRASKAGSRSALVPMIIGALTGTALMVLTALG